MLNIAMILVMKAMNLLRTEVGNQEFGVRGDSIEDLINLVK
jgi:hypothetical protein